MQQYGEEKENEEVLMLRARVADLEMALEQSNSNLAVTFRLTPALNKLLGLLLSLPNVTSEMVHQRLEIATDAKVAVHRLRGYMTPHGIKIHSRRNLGYWLENSDKAKIRDMLKPGSGVIPEKFKGPPPDAAKLSRPTSVGTVRRGKGTLIAMDMNLLDDDDLDKIAM